MGKMWFEKKTSEKDWQEAELQDGTTSRRVKTVESCIASTALKIHESDIFLSLSNTGIVNHSLQL